MGLSDHASSFLRLVQMSKQICRYLSQLLITIITLRSMTVCFLTSVFSCCCHGEFLDVFTLSVESCGLWHKRGSMRLHFDAVRVV